MYSVHFPYGNLSQETKAIVPIAWHTVLLFEEKASKVKPSVLKLFYLSVCKRLWIKLLFDLRKITAIIKSLS